MQQVFNKSTKDDKTVEAALYHQLLCYLQLLETTKPYIVNITRVPGRSHSRCPFSEIYFNMSRFRYSCVITFRQS